jgi:single-stranded-DNA-specific exonuclease
MLASECSRVNCTCNLHLRTGPVNYRLPRGARQTRDRMTVIERRPPAASGALRWPADMHPVLQQVLSRRPLESLEDLELALGRLTPVGSFRSLSAAVDLLLEHRDGRIVIVGDFDSDGATSSALMMLALRELGFRDVSYFIPDRFELGYGLSPGVIERIRHRAPSLIVTVDNGISSVAGVASAREAGIDVLVTDHHVPPEVLPGANVIVNPNVPGDDFGGKHLAGVGVAFYLMAALAKAVVDEPGRVAQYLDLVALGTVADLVTLDRLNRILVAQGLSRIRAGRCRPGILALCEVAGVDYRTAETTTLGYQLAPRLNAAGRLDDMSLGVRCLISESPTEARALAHRLDELNRQRRSLESEMREEALRIVERMDPESSGRESSVVCVYRDNWHEGLVGLIASRLKERCFRPVFAFAPSADGMLKGSGRSIPGFHLRDALALADVERPGLIERFGGHAMAAGLSLTRENLDAFREAMQDVGLRSMSAEQLRRKVLTDGEVAPQHMVLEVAELLQRAGPWGQGFPEPLFDGRFELLGRRWLKDVHLKMTLRPIEGSQPLDAIAFNCACDDIPEHRILRIAYRLAVNDYFETPRLQLVVEHMEHVSSDSPRNP